MIIYGDGKGSSFVKGAKCRTRKRQIRCKSCIAWSSTKATSTIGFSSQRYRYSWIPFLKIRSGRVSSSVIFDGIPVIPRIFRLAKKGQIKNPSNSAASRPSSSSLKDLCLRSLSVLVVRRGQKWHRQARGGRTVRAAALSLGYRCELKKV